MSRRVEGAEVWLYSALAVDAVELSPSRPGHCTPGKKGQNPVRVWIGFIWLSNDLYRTAVSPRIKFHVLIS